MRVYIVPHDKLTKAEYSYQALLQYIPVGLLQQASANGREYALEVKVAITTDKILQALKLNLEGLFQIFKQSNIQHGILATPLHMILLILIYKLHWHQENRSQEGHATLIHPLHQSKGHVERRISIFFHHSACRATQFLEYSSRFLITIVTMQASTPNIIFHQVYHVNIQRCRIIDQARVGHATKDTSESGSLL